MTAFSSRGVRLAVLAETQDYTIHTKYNRHIALSQRKVLL